MAFSIKYTEGVRPGKKLQMLKRSLFKSNWNSNFTKLSTAETKILTTSQTKNAQARRTSSFGIFTSPRPILLASGTGPPTNFEDWSCDIVFFPFLSTCQSNKLCKFLLFHRQIILFVFFTWPSYKQLYFLLV
jgi:hypothetical protein